ncbi:hypothetical protein MMC13_000511 [Lambiella insularis]|nr:hypothetical protein [Lambiella insularis]
MLNVRNALDQEPGLESIPEESWRADEIDTLVSHVDRNGTERRTTGMVGPDTTRQDWTTINSDTSETLKANLLVGRQLSLQLGFHSRFRTVMVRYLNANDANVLQKAIAATCRNHTIRQGDSLGPCVARHLTDPRSKPIVGGEGAVEEKVGAEKVGALTHRPGKNRFSRRRAVGQSFALRKLAADLRVRLPTPSR